jgi:hypothetical protein
MREHLAADRVALRVGTTWKCRPQILDRQSTVTAVEKVEGASEECPSREHRPHRHHADDGDDADHGEVLEAVAERWARTCRRCG